MSLPLRILSSLLLVTLQALATPTMVQASDRRELQIEQQQDALDLTLQHQGIRAQRHDIAPGDARKVEGLQLQQRLQQQQLEQQQWQRQHMLEQRRSVLGDDEVRLRLDQQRNQFRQERQLQTQRFQLDQQRLMQSLPRQALQPRYPPGQLNLP